MPSQGRSVANGVIDLGVGGTGMGFDQSSLWGFGNTAEYLILFSIQMDVKFGVFGALGCIF